MRPFVSDRCEHGMRYILATRSFIHSYHSSGAPCCLSIVTHSARPISIAIFNAVLLSQSLTLASILSSLRS